MPTKAQTDAIGLYAGLMEEIKVRIGCVEGAAAGATGLPSPIVREFCFLQFRLVCELIALGCLAAHGDIIETTRLQKEYSADRIIDRLGQLHSGFFPWPATGELTENLHTLTGKSDGFLTKSELLTLNGRCGDALHRGSLKKLLSSKSPIQNNYRDVLDWVTKIKSLLSMHAIFLLDGETIILCTMSNQDDRGRVQVAIADSKPN